MRYEVSSSSSASSYRKTGNRRVYFKASKLATIFRQNMQTIWKLLLIQISYYIFKVCSYHIIPFCCVDIQTKFLDNELRSEWPSIFVASYNCGGWHSFPSFISVYMNVAVAVVRVPATYVHRASQLSLSICTQQCRPTLYTNKLTRTSKSSLHTPLTIAALPPFHRLFYVYVQRVFVWSWCAIYLRILAYINTQTVALC